MVAGPVVPHVFFVRRSLDPVCVLCRPRLMGAGTGWRLPAPRGLRFLFLVMSAMDAGQGGPGPCLRGGKSPGPDGPGRMTRQGALET